VLVHPQSHGRFDGEYNKVHTEHGEYVPDGVGPVVPRVWSKMVKGKRAHEENGANDSVCCIVKNGLIHNNRAQYNEKRRGAEAENGDPARLWVIHVAENRNQDENEEYCNSSVHDQLWEHEQCFLMEKTAAHN